MSKQIQPLRVQILLSTYNGETYLEEQLKSLLQQTHQPIQILIRDDGSTDKTPNILNNYQQNYPNIKVILGENLGFVRSFFYLLKIADRNYDYFAFCDQDDVWLPNKIERAIDILNQYSSDIPTLYSCRLRLVDEQLNFLADSMIPRKILSFENALIECSLKGCSMVFNQAGLKLINEFPDHAFGHDWWIYLVYSAFGQVVYDDRALILYRQHQNNLFGLSDSFWDNLTGKIKRTIMLRKQQPVIRQAKDFLRIYQHNLDLEKRKTLESLLLTADRGTFVITRLFATIFLTKVYRQEKFDHLVFKYLLLIGWF